MGENIDPTWLCFRAEADPARRLVRGSPRAGAPPLRPARRLPHRDPECAGPAELAWRRSATPSLPAAGRISPRTSATRSRPRTSRPAGSGITGPKPLADAPLALAHSLTEDADAASRNAQCARRHRRARSRARAGCWCQRRARRGTRVRGRGERRQGVVEPARCARRVPGPRGPRRCSRLAGPCRRFVVPG